MLAQEAFYSLSIAPTPSARTPKVTGVSLKAELTLLLKSLEAGRLGMVGSRTHSDITVAHYVFILCFHLLLL